MILVAVPPPVAPIVSVSPESGGGVILVVPAVRPSLASAVPAITRFCVVPVERMTLPPETVEATEAPVVGAGGPTSVAAAVPNAP